MLKKEFSILIVLLLVVGGSAWKLSQDSKENNLIEGTIDIPQECQQFQGEVCDLFSCLVEQCWCKEPISSNPIYKGEDSISNKQEAMDAVEKYLLEINSEYEVADVAEINGFFFNVFAYDSEGEEKVFTIGIDGSILLAVCGV